MALGLENVLCLLVRRFTGNVQVEFGAFHVISQQEGSSLIWSWQEPYPPLFSLSLPLSQHQTPCFSPPPPSVPGVPATTIGQFYQTFFKIHGTVLVKLSGKKQAG